MDINEMNLEELMALIDSIEERQKYNKLEHIIPYEYQKKFMNASKNHRQRFFRCANRVGKSYGCAVEFAYHITGKYPDWFAGDRIENSGHIYWCIGVDLESTANVLQKELFGTSDIRLEDAVGTGTIPKDVIDSDNMIKDGPRLRSCRIKHTDGGYNTLHFFAASLGQDKLIN